MNCHVCGGRLEALTSDLPFKLDRRRTVIVRDLPVRQCRQCGEYLIEDAIMARVEEILAGLDRAAEPEVVRFAA